MVKALKGDTAERSSSALSLPEQVVPHASTCLLRLERQQVPVVAARSGNEQLTSIYPNLSCNVRS